MQIHTAYDVMKEFLITDADLEGKYGIPKIPKTFIHPGKDTVDFSESFSRKIKNHRELDVNFYVDDVQFQRLWNQPDKYMEHLKCFHAVIMPDSTVGVLRWFQGNGTQIEAAASYHCWKNPGRIGNRHGNYKL